MFGGEPDDVIAKHLAAEAIHRYCDTLNMRLVEGWAETAPAFDSVESYVQNQVENCDLGEGSQDEYEGIGDLKEDRKGKGKRVPFADLVTVRPIPATGKGKPTLPRGKTSGSARWQSGETANADAIDRQSDGAGPACKCACGGLMTRGDGKH